MHMFVEVENIMYALWGLCVWGDVLVQELMVQVVHGGHSSKDWGQGGMCNIKKVRHPLHFLALSSSFESVSKHPITVKAVKGLKTVQ